MQRRDFLAGTGGLGLGLMGLPSASLSQTPEQVLRIGMTTSDVPTTGGIPDNGSEGGRFAGYTIYDALVNWDFTKTDDFADLTPGLATEWHIDPDNHLRWIFTIRQGVKFHDGSLLVPEDIVWNFDRHLNKEAAHYDKVQAGSYLTYTSAVKKYEVIGPNKVALYTAQPFSMLPYLLSRVFIVSPRQYAKIGNWQDFRGAPSGTGPFKLVRVIPRTSFEVARNEEYWDRTRVPKLARMILSPVPDALTRVAALQSGQLDFVEYPAPDTIPTLRAAGFQVVTKPYPHIWAWHASNAEGSPLHDIRVRRALNYALDRDAMVALLSGTAIPARGPWPEGSKYFGSPTEHYKYDPAKARALLAEAGYGPSKKLNIKVQVPTSGSGNMVPVPMAEFVQQNFAEFGVVVDYVVSEWGAVLSNMRLRADTLTNPRIDVINHGLPISDPTQLFLNFSSTTVPPNGSNWSMYADPKVDDLLNRAFATFESAQRDALITQAHAQIVDDAPWLFVVHDLNPRALGPKVKGFRQAQSWYQDFTQLYIG